MSNEGFSYDRYIDLLSGQKTYYQALQYKKQCIPIKLYKYLSVKDYTYDTIEKEEIWASETKVSNLKCIMQINLKIESKNFMKMF